MEHMESLLLEQTNLRAGGQGGRLTNSPPAKRQTSDIKYRLDQLITIEELAGKLQISVRTVRDWLSKRKIPFTRLGRRVYIHTGVIENLLQRGAVASFAMLPGPTLTEQGGAH